MLISDYRPSMGGNFHVFDVTFMYETYCLTKRVKIGGNTRGHDLFEPAIDSAVLKILNSDNAEELIDPYKGAISLDDESINEHELKQMVVSVVLVDCYPQEES